ncbi:carboxylesterase/lipase family protein [Actinomycetospora aeridis]|uniref:Carboxylic ester hydrolase n=1 Tax=Actinomycetospora aeridis TaxID=3129231 RepID=A0ABU8N6K3_9PSEU
MPRTGTPRGRRDTWRGLALALLLAVATACATGPEDPSSPVLRTAGGDLQGIDDGSVQRYLGLRYAQPPVGDLRWAPPVAVPAWSGVRPVTASGPRCPQRGGASAGQVPADQSEDCLFLDVTVPTQRAADARLPVVVWWHGGGYVSGAGSDVDPRRLAEQGVVVVSVNYRLGLLGYLGLPGLVGSGSFGFLDQLASLRWVRDNVAAFGGDPAAVTVAGQSAGAAAVCALLGSPALGDLGVARAIVMSGSCSVSWPPTALGPDRGPRRLYAPREAVEAAGAQTAAGLGCTGPDAATCLRGRSTAQLLDATPPQTVLAYGSDVLPVEPGDALDGRRTPIPVLIGTTHDEARAFVRPQQRADPARFGPSAYPRLLEAAFGGSADAVEREYPLARHGGSGPATWSAVLTDTVWSCPTLRDEQALARSAPTFAYEFAAPDPDPGAGDEGPNRLPVGAQHSGDLPLLFDVPGVGSLPDAEQDLGRRVVASWAAFARTGRPDGPGLPPWEPADRDGVPRPTVLGVEGVAPYDASVEHHCGFWARTARAGAR